MIRNVKKSFRWCYLLILLLVAFLFGCTNRSDEFDMKESATESEETKNMLGNKVGPLPEPVVMNAENPSIVNPVSLDQIADLENQIQDKESRLYSLLQLSMVGSGFFKVGNGGYIATRAIPFYDAVNDSVSTVAYVLAFDKKQSQHFVFSCTYENGAWFAGSCHALPSEMEEAWEEDPDEKYLYIFNSGTLVLSPENEIYGVYGKFTVEGDYYHALDYETLALSYNEIISELIWVEACE